MTNLMLLGAGGFPQISIVSQPITYYYVSSTGNDSNTGLDVDHPWQTISKVNGYSFSPDSAIAFNGTDTFLGRISLSAAGINGHPIIATSYGSGLSTINAESSYTDAFTCNGQSYITVENLHFVGGTVTTLSIDKHHISVLGCEIEGNGSSESNGISVWAGGDHCFIDSCTVHDELCYSTGGAGIYATSASYLTVTNNSIYSCGDDMYKHGIYFVSCVDSSISHNSSRLNSGNGIEIRSNCTGLEINANYVDSNTESGISIGELGESNDCKAINNIISNNGHTGIYCGSNAPDVLIAFNTIINHGRNGINIGEHGCSIMNNIVCQDVTVVGEYRNPIRIEDTDVFVDATFNNNLYYYNTTSDWGSSNRKIVILSSPETEYNFTEWKALASSPDGNSVEGSPVFVTNYTNLHLQTTSPAKNAGVAISGVNYDYDDVERGSPPDIGAYEYV